MKVIAYTIYSNSTPERLVKALNIAIKNNWSPLGSPYTNGINHFQAMVKYEKSVGVPITQFIPKNYKLLDEKYEVVYEG